MRVLMSPHLSHFRTEESGIKRVVEAYFRHLPQFGVELVGLDDAYDLTAGHAGMSESVDVAHCHGLYWSADYNAAQWEWRANADVIKAIRGAREVTVPSHWVAETFQRDMRFTPHVIGHGIDWDAWQTPADLGDYVLWNKNRAGDVCDPRPVEELARGFPAGHFVSTFSTGHNPPRNLNVTGVIAHDQMRKLVQGALVYLATTKETFGIGILEALASGTPVLGYGHGGILDIVEHGVTGYLARPYDDDDLAAGLDYCLTHRAQLGANAREAARAFTWERIAEQVANVYRKALAPDPATVAIVIPSYNYGDKVGGAIESAVKQSYGLLTEIVVVDDGSDDGGATQQAVSEWTQRDNRVRYVRKHNGGVATARNAGIAETDAKYVCCLDADDAIAPNFLSACVSELEGDRTLGIAYTGLWYRKPDGAEGLSAWPGDFDYDAQVQGRNQIPTCCVFRRVMWERLGGYRQRYAPDGAGEEDAEFWLRAGAYGWDAKLVEPWAEFQAGYANLKQGLRRDPTREDAVANGIDAGYWDAMLSSAFRYSWQSGQVSGNRQHAATDWRAMHPWTRDGQHPFASVAKPKRFAHPVRQYDDPLVSVVIPVGPGHEGELLNALDSLEAQTFRNWEAVVVWDSDKPRSDSLQRAYPYVRWLATEGRQGAGVARNRGAEHARAPFLLYLDADDSLHPEAIDKMLDGWEEHHAAIYTDYVGLAIVGDPSKLARDLQARIYHYNKKTQEAAIGYRAFDYDCERAQRQPEGDRPYIWCNITTLIPRLWHEEVGGFDESLETWEDVDYWWRMARQGRCFVRLPEELLVYRFYTGGRRDKGVQEHAQLVEYLRNKYEGEDTMACSGCRKSRPATQTVTHPTPAGATSLSMRVGQTQNDDDEWVLCEYLHRNTGQHLVYGGTIFRTPLDGVPMLHRSNGWQIKYGYRGGGEQFLVHRSDVKAASNLFRVVPQGPKAPEPERVAPPPPPSIAPPPQRATVPAPRAPQPVADDEPPSLSPDPFDLQKLPGVGGELAAQLREAGVATREDIVAIGVEGLKQFKGVGDHKAKIILGAIERQMAG